MTRNRSRFQPGSGVYKCRSCGKRTRDTGLGEGEVLLCAACYDAAGIENEHYDGHHDDEPREDCPLCQEGK